MPSSRVLVATMTQSRASLERLFGAEAFVPAQRAVGDESLDSLST